MEPRGKRLLASLADDLAERDAERCFSVIPKGADVSNGFQAVNMRDLSRAVNCMSWWIESTIGPAQARETLAYMANNDIRYCIFMMACQKTGYQVRERQLVHIHGANSDHTWLGFSSFYKKLRRGPSPSSKGNGV